MSIPRIIHQIWIGGRPLPEEFKRYAQTWMRAHPAWEYRLWDEDRLAQFDLRNKQAFAGARSLAEKADILRYEIIASFGGVYADMDFECLRPIDDLIAPLKCFAASEADSANYVSIGILGAEPEHVVFREAVRQLPLNIQRFPAGSPVYRTGPVFFTRIIRPYLRLPDVRVFGKREFYPYLYTEMHRKKENFFATCPQCYAVHHWAHSWRHAAT